MYFLCVTLLREDENNIKEGISIRKKMDYYTMVNCLNNKQYVIIKK